MHQENYWKYNLIIILNIIDDSIEFWCNESYWIYNTFYQWFKPFKSCQKKHLRQWDQFYLNDYSDLFLFLYPFLSIDLLHKNVLLRDMLSKYVLSSWKRVRFVIKYVRESSIFLLMKFTSMCSILTFRTIKLFFVFWLKLLKISHQPKKTRSAN